VTFSARIEESCLPERVHVVNLYTQLDQTLHRLSATISRRVVKTGLIQVIRQFDLAALAHQPLHHLHRCFLVRDLHCREVCVLLELTVNQEMYFKSEVPLNSFYCLNISLLDCLKHRVGEVGIDVELLLHEVRWHGAVLFLCALTLFLAVRLLFLVVSFFCIDRCLSPVFAFNIVGEVVFLLV
jgi:hypothetical protein